MIASFVSKRFHSICILARDSPSVFCKITLHRDEYYNVINSYVNINYSIIRHIITSIEGFRMFSPKTSMHVCLTLIASDSKMM